MSDSGTYWTVYARPMILVSPSYMVGLATNPPWGCLGFSKASETSQLYNRNVDYCLVNMLYHETENGRSTITLDI